MFIVLCKFFDSYDGFCGIYDRFFDAFSKSIFVNDEDHVPVRVYRQEDCKQYLMDGEFVWLPDDELSYALDVKYNGEFCTTDKGGI